ncbi:unnamed protein product, partial [Ascophyllum nodosum]
VHSNSHKTIHPQHQGRNATGRQWCVGIIPRRRTDPRVEGKDAGVQGAFNAERDHNRRETRNLWSRTGIISFTIRNSHGARLPVNLRALIVPGLGCNIVAPTAELKNGVRFVLEVGYPHLTIGGIIIPLKQNPRDQGMCSLDIMFQRIPQDELLGKPEGVSHDDVPGVVYAATADADIWHQRL